MSELVGGGPSMSGVVVGRLDRGELDERLQALLLRADDALVEGSTRAAAA